MVLGVPGAGLLVAAFFLARHVGLSPLAAALVAGWLSPVLVGRPLVLYALVFHNNRQRRNDGVPPTARDGADGEMREP